MNPHRPSPSEDSLCQQMLWGIDLGAFDSPLGQRLVRAWQLGVVDPVIQRLIEDTLRPFLKQQALGTLPPFKAARLGHGGLVLGRDLHGRIVRVPLQWLTAGLLLVSNTGGGKSNLLCFLLLQLALRGCPVWVCDHHKTQLRRLRPLFRKLGVPLVILRPKEWRWNLLQPQLCDRRRHLAMATDLLVRVLDLPPRARSILSQGGHELYRRFGL